MRETKFRGKSLETGEWIYGSLIQMNNTFSIMSHDIYAHPGWQRFEVDPETVGQWLGIADRKGVDVYEGDFVEDAGDKTTAHWISAVEWGDLGFYLTHGHPAERDLWELYVRDRLLVIGNGADNPELLA